MAQIRNFTALNGGLEDLFVCHPDLRDKLIPLRNVSGVHSDDKWMRPDKKSHEYQFTFLYRLEDRIQSYKGIWEMEGFKDKGHSVIDVFGVNQRYFTNPESNPPKLCLSADIYIVPVTFMSRDSPGTD